MAIDSNPFKEGTKAYIFLEACNVDYADGFSEIVEVDRLAELGLQTDNGCGWGRSDGPLGKIFNIKRAKKHGRIFSIQLVGYAQNEFTGYIDKKIVDAYKHEPCRVLAVKGKYIEIDHKDGRKTDYKLHDNQTLSDFQPMHKNVNTAKRQHCKTCATSGIRFDATTLGYSCKQIKGPEEYHGSCIGCYWFDPQAFNAAASSTFIKTK